MHSDAFRYDRHRYHACAGRGCTNWAWPVLPASALLELAGITAFAINIFGTFILEPSHAQKQPLVIGRPPAA